MVIFAAVYGLRDADIATIGIAAATQLNHALGLSNVELGALASVATGVGALATLPAGVLADRVNRIRLLAGAGLCGPRRWSLARSPPLSPC